MLQVVASASIILSVLFADVPDRPPRPDFKDPVNYTSWWQGQLSAGKPENDNAYRLYEQFLPGPDGRGGFPAMAAAAKAEWENWPSIGPWEPEAFPAMAAYLNSCQPYFRLLEQAAEKEHSIVPIPASQEVFQERATEAQTMVRKASRFMLVAAWMKHPRQTAHLENAIRTSLHQAAHFEQHGFVIDELLAIALRSTNYTTVRYALDSSVFSPKNANEIYQLLAQHDPRGGDWRVIYLSEWVAALQITQAVCGNIEKLKAKLKARGFESPLDCRRSVSEIDRFYGYLCKAVENGPSLHALNNIKQFLERERARDDVEFIIAMTGLRVDRAFQLALRVECERRGTMTLLALLMHYQKHDRWPSTLDKIDDAMGLVGLSDNIIDPLTNKPFIYKRTDGSMTLYTALEDGIDHNGRHDPGWDDLEGGADFVFWPLPNTSE